MTEIDNAIARIHDRIVYNDERHHAIRNSLVSLECTLREIDREIEREIDPEMLSELYAQRQNISDRYFGAKDAHERLYVEYRDCQHRLAVLTEAASYV